MKMIKIVAMIAVLAIQAGAQDSLLVKRRAGVLFSFGAGCLCGIQNGNASTILNANGFPAFSRSMVTAQLGVGLWIDRFSILYQLKAYSTGSDQGNSSYGLLGRGFSGELRFQYELLKTGKFYVTPYAGFGAQQFLFSFDSKAPVDFNSALQISTLPIFSRQLSVAEIVGSAGAGFGVIRRKSNRSYKLGLQAGYQFAGLGSWRLNNELVQIPSSTFSGLELRFEIAVIYGLKRRK